jgi:rhamnosyl/mannosyltransferase
MNILKIITEAPPITSGVARVAHELTTRLTARGHRVETLSSHDIPRLELGEVRLSSMPWRGWGRVLGRAQDYDVVHVHGPAPTFSEVALLYALLGRRGRRPAVVYTHHCEIDLQGYEPLCGAYNAAHRLLASLADHVVTSTPSYARLLRGLVPRRKISTIPWGVAAGRPAGGKGPGLDVLYVGQLRPYKGLDVLLRAAPLLPEARVTVIGGGHQEQAYRQMAAGAGLANVQFLGRASDEETQRAYARAHALVLPSLTRAEAFGLVLLEGMAAGCVPVASRLPGLTDVVDGAGFTFQPGDAASLAAALRQLLDDPGHTARLAVEARRRAEQFSWEASAAAYERLFADLTTSRSATAVDWFPQTLHAEGLANQELVLAERVVDQLFEPALDRFAPSRASLLLCLPPEDLMILAQRGLDSALIGARLKSHRSVAGWVAANRRPVIISPGHQPRALRPYLRNPHLASSLSLPVLLGDRVVAVLNLARQRHERHYTLDDLRELTAWAPRTLPELRVDVGPAPRVAA